MKVNEFIKLSKHLLSKDGIWVLMTGPYPEMELAHCDYSYSVHKIEVPFLSKQRHVVIVKNKGTLN